MRIQIISPPCVEWPPAATGKAAGLARGGAALVSGGIIEELTKVGADVVDVVQPTPRLEQVSPDPVVNLGRYNRLVADAVVAGAERGAAPLLLGGTCSHLIGMIAGLQRVYGATARIGLVWFDAHGDFNTPRTTRSGMLGGMPVAVCAGLCLGIWRELAGQLAPLPTDRILMVDVRHLDPDEETLIGATEVQIARFWGKPDAVEKAVQQLAQRVDHLYVHVDADVLDASLQPNHPTAEPDGPDGLMILLAIRAAMDTGKVRAFGVVSINPDGPEGTTSLMSGRWLIRRAVAVWGGNRVINV